MPRSVWKTIHLHVLTISQTVRGCSLGVALRSARRRVSFHFTCVLLLKCRWMVFLPCAGREELVLHASLHKSRCEQFGEGALDEARPGQLVVQDARGLHVDHVVEEDCCLAGGACGGRTDRLVPKQVQARVDCLSAVSAHTVAFELRCGRWSVSPMRKLPTRTWSKALASC